MRTMGEDLTARGVATTLLVGVGGQGTILAGDLLAKTAAASGMDAKISEIHGMAQRGGSVSTVVRFGRAVSSMICDEGTADLVVAFELIEARRAVPFLAPTGTLIANDELVSPVMSNIGAAPIPADLRARLLADGALLVPAADIARKAGSPKSTNVVLMGALSTRLPFDVSVWRDVIAARVPARTVEANLEAFEQGRVAASR